MSRLSGMLNDWIVPFETLGKVPLPWGEDDFSRGRLSENLIMFTDLERNNSFFAEIIRIGGLWYSSPSLTVSHHAQLQKMY